MTFPCKYCGDCPIWLASFNHPDLITIEQIRLACQQAGCYLVGVKVEDAE